MVSSKLELALVAVIAAGLLAIECEHRIVIGMPAAAEAGPPVASVCPSTDNVPIGAACMSFIGGASDERICAAMPPRREKDRYIGIALPSKQRNRAI